MKLAQLSAPAVRAFEDKLREEGRSATAVRVTRTRLGMLIADAQERGQVNRNVVRELRRRKERKAERRAKGKLKVGVDIPTPDEVRALLPCLRGRWRPLLLTAIFCGLRGSELRGLRWADVDLDKGELQRRSLPQDRPPEERGRRAYGAGAAAGVECP
jgi:integrase